MKNDVSQRIQQLHDYLADNARIDSEYWYEGLSSVNHIVSTFDNRDIIEFSKQLYGWEQHLLTCLSAALTYDQDDMDKPVRCYFYAHIFLALNDTNLLDVVDDFDFLNNSDARLSNLLKPLKAKVSKLIHHEAVRTACLQLLIDLEQTLGA
ncbi:hypothetical protein [Pedobacter helvus]|uniref:Immunity protein 30 domain-containing protein n=1 Tax=Pedobacter helvus TaxID=2563444 RepID=A0ABW9JEC7_9SPHI|nr:hypothetical protein [Pedobacter ureilyticus]